MAELPDNEGPELVESPLTQRVTLGACWVDVNIHRMSDETTWVLEIEDHLMGSTVWDERFANDADALAEAMKAIDEDGIESFHRATGRGG